ncbi:MAG: cyclic pyranopterin monophosphate synthase MoaC [Planctomycetota bacterium]
MAKQRPRGLTHLDARGRARIVDVSAKEVTARLARASGEIRMAAKTLRLLKSGRAAKGDVLAVARVAGIQAAKDTARWIPLCHPLGLNSITVEFELAAAASAVVVTAEARVTARTGVEMEAMTAVAAALLTIYDMLKAVDRGMVLGAIRLEEKRGGRSGVWRRAESGTRAKRGLR